MLVLGASDSRMKEETAHTVANVVLAAVAVGAAVVVLRTPALRRLAFGLARTAITTSIPLWLSHQVKQAWAESDPTMAGAEGTDARSEGRAYASST